MSSTPRFTDGKSSSGWQRTSTTGISPPGRISTNGCPHCVRRLRTESTYHAQAVAGQEYHYPYCLSSPYWELPGTHRRLFLAPCRKGKACRPFRSFGISLLSAYRRILAQSLKWLMLITITIGMYLMNGYSVIKVLWGHRKAPSLYLPLSEGAAHLYSKIFFNFSRIRIFLLCTALRYTPSSAAYSRSVLPSK